MLEARRVSAAALLLLPAALVLYFAFDSGGFHPGPPAYVAMLLCLVLLLRVTVAASPFSGLSRSLALAAGALALYSLLTVLSGSWSHAPGVTRVEFDLPLVYLLAMLLFGSIAHTRARLRWMVRGLAVATVVVCTCGLITRVLPHVWRVSPEIANQRLSFPVTYWNALGLVAAIGIVLCFHISSDLREPRAARVPAAAAVPILAATLFFTFSRGAIATCVIALLAYALLGRPRGMLSSLLAAGPAAAVAIKFAYDANQLDTPNPTTPSAVIQGHHVAIALAGCVAGAAILRAALAPLLDEPLRQFALPVDVRRPAARAGWLAIATAVLVAIIAFNGTLANDYHRFLHPAPVATRDLRARLTDPSNNGRIDFWTVAWHQFKSAPVVGHGAGTFQNAWARYRPYYAPARDAHSLYMETFDELGIVGLILLLTTILTVLARVATRARGRGRPLYAAVFAVLLAWAIHAVVDWDWEMPVVTIVFFALGGFAIARRRPRSRRGDDDVKRAQSTLVPGSLTRASVAAACVLLALASAYVWLSQIKLDDAAYAFSQGNCTAARSAALSSISVLGNRAEPYEILSYCDVRLGMPQAALAAIDKAVSLDPSNWNYRYGVALMRAAAGLNPRAAAREALLMNPTDPFVRGEWQRFGLGSPAHWKAEAKVLIDSFTTL